ncbi:MAG: Rab proteins geranylgeranyltransferase component A [Pycnora praestabilis]|nr:MAG: Rab proteins geranylgeranyltransferase component A [Pycnora praestabilis]
MESLSETVWDVFICGTGLQQSLLALALSRSGKKVLHVDKNDYYGGSEAAFSLQEAEEWVKTVRNAAINLGSDTQDGIFSSSGNLSLSFSRAYSLSLSPQLIYTRSTLLPILVSSKVYRQLEFQSVGNWWIYSPLLGHIAEQISRYESLDEPPHKRRKGDLRRVPNGREDVFADNSIDLRSKRSLMKFLKFVANYETDLERWEAHASGSFPDFLSTQFGLPPALHPPLLALTLSPDTPRLTTTAFALPRIARHLRSIGMFGPGFASVIPKWGGGAEIAQVGCRAGAVGGGVYVLGRGVDSISAEPATIAGRDVECGSTDPVLVEVRLKDEDAIKARWVVGAAHDLPSGGEQHIESAAAVSISVVSSSLDSLMPVTAEGAPPPAGAVVFFPTGSIRIKADGATPDELPPIYVIVHSSDTGECPAGQLTADQILFQGVLYASTNANTHDGHAQLNEAVACLLESIEQTPIPKVIWSLHYTQTSSSSISSAFNRTTPSSTSPPPAEDSYPNVLRFPSPSLDLAFDDAILQEVKDVWEKIVADDEDKGEFMVFEDREGMGNDGNDEE